MASAAEIYGRDIAFKGDLVATPSGDFDTLYGLDNLHESLFRRLITFPGSLSWRSQYGIGIHRWQNAISSLAAHREIAITIREQFTRDPRVEEVSGVSIESPPNKPEMTKIKVRIKPVGYDERVLEFEPFGEENG